MQYRIDFFSESPAWDELVNTSPQGSIFSTTQFLDSLGCSYERVVIYGDAQILLGALILMDANGLPRSSPHMFTLYQGILFSSAYSVLPTHRRAKLGLELIDMLLNAVSERYPRFSFSLHHTLEDLRGFQWFNYHSSEQPRLNLQLSYTGLINLDQEASFDSYLGSIRQVKRQEYRKGLSLEYRPAGLESVDILARLHRLTFERQSIEYDENQARLLRSIARGALEKSFGNLMVCWSSGEPIAATLFLQDAHTSYYLFGANHPEYRKMGAGTFLALENIRLAFDMRLHRVDLVGINSPGRGDFKTSLNAKPAPYFSVAWQAAK